MTMPRLESGLPDDFALRQRGVRNESAYFAPLAAPGAIQQDTTSYVRVQQGPNDAAQLALYTGQDYVPLEQ